MSIIGRRLSILLPALFILADLRCHAAPLQAAAAAVQTSSAADLEAARALRDAELRKAVADAERAELLARAPLAVPGLAGTVETRGLGAAALVKAFDLTGELAAEVCAALPADRVTVIHDPATAQGIVAARTVSDSLGRVSDDLVRQNRALQAIIERHAPDGSASRPLALLTPAIVPATVKAVADLTALFKTDVAATGTGYGEGARALFATALATACGPKMAGLGGGYLGELDLVQHDRLMARVRTLVGLRGEYANRIALVQRLADGAKGEPKKDLAAVANAAGALLKTVDAFVDSLKAGEASEKSPLFNAARYLGYAGRVSGALVLDFDLRLEGLSIVKDRLLTGQQLRLAGVALLWYRLHEPNGSLRLANTARRVTKPVEVDLRGEAAGGDFWQR